MKEKKERKKAAKYGEYKMRDDDLWMFGDTKEIIRLKKMFKI